MSETSFQHSSARVPRLYKEAGKIVQKVKEEGGSLKGLLFSSKHTNRKGLHALVAETLRHASELDFLLRQTQILVKEPRLDPWVTRVLITELLWRQRPLNGEAIPLKIVQSYKSELLSKQPDIATQVAQPVPRSSRPRFVRINTLKASQQEVIDFFLQEGWQEFREFGQNDRISDEEKYTNFLQKISSLSEDEFLYDAHVPNLIIFPGSFEFYKLDFYNNGLIILQDKASCMSAYLLDPPLGSTVLDMCAAPGMKTTHAAAILNNLGTIYAIERNERRFDSLCQVVSQCGASCVKPILGDALQFGDKDLPDVEYILVDPSCSGSGMNTRKEFFNDSEDVSTERLQKLSYFQGLLLRHAMTNFPKVKRIVYSTCSVYPEENEAVVADVLKNAPPNFKPVIPTLGVSWMKRGTNLFDQGDFGFYARPEIDMTNGFFVTVFERTENEYVCGKMRGCFNEADNNRKKKQNTRSKSTDYSSLDSQENSIQDSTSVSNEYTVEKENRKTFTADNAVQHGTSPTEKIEATQNDIDKPEGIRKKRKKMSEVDLGSVGTEPDRNGDFHESENKEERKKKKKKKMLDDELISGTTESENNFSGSNSLEDHQQVEKIEKKKKKKKKAKCKSSEDDKTEDVYDAAQVVDHEIKKKKKKKSHVQSLIDTCESDRNN